MKLIWTYLKRYPKWLVLDVIGALTFVVVNLGLPTALARMIDQGVTVGNKDKVYFWALVMLVVIILGMIGRVILAYAAGKITTNMIKDMRNDMYDKLQQYSHQEYEQIGVSSLVTRMTSDAFILMQFAEQTLRMGVITPLMMISSVVMILVTSPTLAWIVAVAIPFLVLVVYYVATRTRPLSEKQQSTLDKINQYVRENLTGLRVIRAFAREDFQEQRFGSKNDEYKDLSSRLFILTGLTEPLFVLIIISMIVAIVWFALNPLAHGELQIGNLVAFIEYSFHALFSFLLFANFFTMYPRMVVSSERISEVMAMPISIDPNDDGVTETVTKGYLEFDKVTFAYPGETESPVLKDISFKAKPGETIAFIGSTGSGKSSLVNLIPRFYDVTLGKILVDGVDVRDYQLKALRQKIGFIPQKALLFTGTIEENLKYGKSDATSEELQAAADIAQAKEFIESRDDRYQTHLAEGGSNLSGGQKQRLSIARAVVKKPDIYIFDDSFSALDYKTDAQLRARLKEVTQEATVLIVAQRVGTIMDADQIIVLDKGEIVGRGTHDELMQSNDIYREIANSQLNKAEEMKGE
ncbi:ABC transporter, ATP-binding/permease protein [Streptococcus infantarius subsp. infantarius]|uniref:ABC transporter ATP-binding protein n=1 Tax=uncultured Streptococcus sp. TaxID=83427 RepID=UPI00208EFFFF|nr:ABC transporter ATP-binding protein [uncultured Streptococcus sp.]MCO4478281.1 ABC transporter, ATP-binding/permease protein [Streptococcus infantarius subsp. infantarius]MCO4597009.1 ABC transporter, ATP-binding/permease protein [Streptococcus infantarius subsp. infantarius]MCO4601671.1 ABC transporter, ATP-binding/permease protein [Streptococcus infantarius subsp. infantarius]MCO4602470.1 ABC transporter, ATP-binding/permease protein [Streptococcus infantarius subsp. infantarius]MCO462286